MTSENSTVTPKTGEASPKTNSSNATKVAPSAGVAGSPKNEVKKDAASAPAPEIKK